jgi:hypothetical protein
MVVVLYSGSILRADGKFVVSKEPLVHITLLTHSLARQGIWASLNIVDNTMNPVTFLIHRIFDDIGQFSS